MTSLCVKNIILVAALVLGVVLSALAEVCVLRLAYKKRIFDSHNFRKIHRGNVPRLGGTVFFPVILIVIGLLVSVCLRLAPADTLQEINQYANYVVCGLCAAMTLFVSGLLDDLKGLRYRTKFVVQIVAGLFLCAAGLWLHDMHGFLGIGHIPAWAGWPLTIFIVVLVTNAINFIDGIDGLAGCVCSLGLMYYAWWLYRMPGGSFTFVLLTVATLGVVIPYLWFNIMGTPERGNKIFMGDTGSLLLGFVLVALAVMIANGPVCGGCDPMVVAFAPLLVPCFDVVRVVLVRVAHHCNPFTADLNHIHHCMLRVGFSQHATLAVLLLLMAAMTVWSCLLSIWLGSVAVFVADVALYAIFVLLITRRATKR